MICFGSKYPLICFRFPQQFNRELIALFREKIPRSHSTASQAKVKGRNEANDCRRKSATGNAAFPGLRFWWAEAELTKWICSRHRIVADRKIWETIVSYQKYLSESLRNISGPEREKRRDAQKHCQSLELENQRVWAPSLNGFLLLIRIHSIG